MDNAPALRDLPSAEGTLQGVEFVFGPFRFYPNHRLLTEWGERKAIGTRALAILALLVERAGSIVSATEIMDQAWPGTFVEDNNIRVQITAIRKALGDETNRPRYIVNEPGRGYRFIARVERVLARGAAAATPPAAQRAFLPLALTNLIGRAGALADVVRMLSETRLLTLVGPGGIGKTGLAKAAGQNTQLHYQDGACFVDLAPLTHAELVASAVASALHVPLPAGTATAGLVDLLKDKTLLIILDNCEHVALAAARLAESLLESCAGIRILATSREALRIEGERLYRLLPLDISAEPPASAQSALASPAVQLFVERASASSSFELTDANAAIISQICRSLDGLPLAIEFGAACAVTLGLDALSSGLSDRLALLSHGRRTEERHQTLRALLDWSYDILPETEARIFARLAVFSGWFSLDAVAAVTAGAEDELVDVFRAIGNLAAKSLISVDLTSHVARYRLLETTRAYAAEKLRLSGVRRAVCRRHAIFFYDGLATGETEWRTLTRQEWWATYGPRIDDIRSALDWAFSSDGDIALAIRLTAASAPIWLGMSKLEEYHQRLEQALSSFPVDGPDLSEEELRLNLLVGVNFMNVIGPSPKRHQTLQRAAALAGQLENRPGQLTTNWAQCGLTFARGEYFEAMTYADQLMEIAAKSADVETVALAQRMLALAHYGRGNFDDAQRLGEQSVGLGPGGGPSFTTVFRYDQTTTARANLSMVLFIKGFADQACAILREAVADAMRARNPNTLVYILSHIACPVALWAGDQISAKRYNGFLLREAQENGFSYMRALGDWWDTVLSLRGGHLSSENHAPQFAFSQLYPLQQDLIITTLPELVDEPAILRATRFPSHWGSAEILRAAGDNLLRRYGLNAAPEAQRYFEQALGIARRQGALGWELRAALSLAKLGRELGRPILPDDTLAGVVARFTEGTEALDMKDAKAFLAEAAG